MNDELHRIVITGAPGTGKTAVIEGLQAIGYHVFPEVIREFTAEETATQETPQLATNPIVFARDSEDFNRKLISGRTRQFLQGHDIASRPVFYDRGLPDVLAYMDFFGQTYGADFLEVCRTHRYDKVFLMPPWEEIFHADGGRFETYQQALALHESLIVRYTAFEYDLLEVPKGTIDERIDHILSTL